MASITLGDRVKVSTATAGTGTVTLGSAFSNAFCTFAEAGVTDGSTVAYCIEDGSDFELGTGVYTASGTTMTRATVLLSKISGVAGTTKLTLSGSATVRIVALAEHLPLLPDANTFTNTQTIDAGGTHTFPDGWANNFKLVDTLYPAIWFHGGTNNRGCIYAMDTSTRIFWLEEETTGGASDANSRQFWDFANHYYGPSVDGEWALGASGHSWGTVFVGSGGIELGNASDTTLLRESAGSVTIEGNRVYSALANQFPALTEKTTPTSADLLLIEDSAASDAKKKLQLGNVAPYIFHNLATDVAGTNVNTAQPWFPDLTNGAVTLAANTTYRFAGLLYISRSAGATSHTTGIGFGGTATVASIMGIATCKTGDTTALAAADSVIINSTANTNIKAASTATTEQIQVVIEGTLRIGTGGGGTLIPQFTFSAAPAGVPTIKANSFFELAPIGTDLATSAGTWS